MGAASSIMHSDQKDKPLYLQPQIVLLNPKPWLLSFFGESEGKLSVATHVTEDPNSFVETVDGYFPALAILSLSVDTDWQTAVMRCKLRPQTRHIPLIALICIEDVNLITQARESQLDYVLETPEAKNDLPSLIQQIIHPPTRYPDGWDAPLPPLVRQGLLEFNAGKFFEQHESLEEAWVAEKRPIREVYQGILQIGVAFLQIERGNWAGAIKVFRRALPKLRGLPPAVQGIQLGKFLASAEEIHAEITQLGRECLSEFDQRTFPQIDF